MVGAGYANLNHSTQLHSATDIWHQSSGACETSSFVPPDRMAVSYAIWTPATPSADGFTAGNAAPNWRRQSGRTRPGLLTGGRITGYATALASFGHALAETNLDMQV